VDHSSSNSKTELSFYGHFQDIVVELSTSTARWISWSRLFIAHMPFLDFMVAIVHVGWRL